MDPVDPGPALRRIDRAGRAEDDHRRAIAPGVVDRHQPVHEADIAVQRHGHRLAGHLGVAMRHRHRMLLVQAQDHLRVAIAEMIDQAVVESAIGGTGIEADIGNAQGAQHVGGDVAAPARRRVLHSGRALDVSWTAHLAIFQILGLAGDEPSRLGRSRTIRSGLAAPITATPD